MFTKQDAFDYEHTPGNLIVRYSQWPGFTCGPPDAKRMWVCPKNIEPQVVGIPRSARHCPGKCDEKCGYYCWFGPDDVWIKQH